MTDTIMAEHKPLDQKDEILEALARYIVASEMLWQWRPNDSFNASEIRERMLVARRDAETLGFLWPQ